MPNISDLSTPLTEFPNKFASPFGNDGVTPLYSSIPVYSLSKVGGLPCVVCGGSLSRRQVIDAESRKYPTSPSDGSVTVSQ